MERLGVREEMAANLDEAARTEALGLAGEVDVQPRAECLGLRG